MELLVVIIVIEIDVVCAQIRMTTLGRIGFLTITRNKESLRTSGKSSLLELTIICVQQNFCVYLPLLIVITCEVSEYMSCNNR